ncbi:MAG: hypothetical protein MUF52_00045 [Syntrophobacteraceae bacterium]|jgi:hypothetical protein|nr:hypothetical protein [Syntrophobacteraceae bacterium]
MRSTLPLDVNQINELRRELVVDGIPVCFLVDGKSVLLTTGQKLDEGRVYSNFTRETACKIADWIGATPLFFLKP